MTLLYDFFLVVVVLYILCLCVVKLNFVCWVIVLSLDDASGMYISITFFIIYIVSFYTILIKPNTIVVLVGAKFFS